MSALSDLFQDIADAIRTKTGDTGSMKPASFPENILAIEGGGGSNQKVILPKQSSDSFSSDNQYGLCAFEVPDSTNLESLVAGEEYIVYWNGETYTCTAIDTSSVIPKSITIGNGSAFGFAGNNEPFGIYSVSGAGYVVISLEGKTTNEFAIYQAVSGESADFWLEFGQIASPGTYSQKWVVWNGDIYVFASTTQSGSNDLNVYKYSGGAWTTIISAGMIATSGWAFGYGSSLTYIPWSDGIHLFDEYSRNHAVFNGTTFTVKADLPATSDSNAFVHEGKFKYQSNQDTNVYVWDESNDTWTAEASIGSKYSIYNFLTVGDVAYAVNGTTVYKYESGALTEIGSLSNSVSDYMMAVIGSNLYYYYNRNANSSTTVTRWTTWYKYDFVTNTEIELGCSPYITNYASLVSYQNKVLLTYGANSARPDTAVVHGI